MELDIISYHDLITPEKSKLAFQRMESALLSKGIAGVRDIPEFEKTAKTYINAARKFSAQDEAVKLRYAPERDAGKREGYELGAERFLNTRGEWQVDDQKASFYAAIPDDDRNVWPTEMDLKTAYVALGDLIFNTGKLVLKALKVDESLGIQHKQLDSYGRMLHYHKKGAATNDNPDWCGAHFDHGILTGLLPAYYFQNGVEVEEPAEAGLYIIPTNQNQFEKIHAHDKSILLFQVGEFGQLASNDRIRATKHIVKKSKSGIERFTFALFIGSKEQMTIFSTSLLTADARYADYKAADGSISYGKWDLASMERYRAS